MQEDAPEMLFQPPAPGAHGRPGPQEMGGGEGCGGRGFVVVMGACPP